MSPALCVLSVPGVHQWAKVLKSHVSVSLSASPCTYPGAGCLGGEKVLLNWHIHLICFLDARRTSHVHSVDFNRAVAKGALTLRSEVTSLRLHGAAQANVVLGASPP